MSLPKTIFTSKIIVTIFMIILVPILILAYILLYLYWFPKSIWLCFLVRLQWIPKRKFGVFVYTNRRRHKGYIEANIIPKLGSLYIINWSELKSKQRDYKKILDVKVFHHWTGIGSSLFHNPKSFITSGNPITKYNLLVAIIFKPWWSPKIVSFGRCLVEYSHGNTKPIN